MKNSIYKTGVPVRNDTGMCGITEFFTCGDFIFLFQIKYIIFSLILSDGGDGGVYHAIQFGDKQTLAAHTVLTESLRPHSFVLFSFYMHIRNQAACLRLIESVFITYKLLINYHKIYML